MEGHLHRFVSEMALTFHYCLRDLISMPHYSMVSTGAVRHYRQSYSYKHWCQKCPATIVHILRIKYDLDHFPTSTISRTYSTFTWLLTRMKWTNDHLWKLYSRHCLKHPPLAMLSKGLSQKTMSLSLHYSSKILLDIIFQRVRFSNLGTSILSWSLLLPILACHNLQCILKMSSC